MKGTFVVPVFLLCTCLVFAPEDVLAQASGRILEEGTGLPVEGALVRTDKEQVASDKDGVYQLQYARDNDEVIFSLLGYFNKQLRAAELKTQDKIYLRRNYNTLAAAEVKDKGINVNDIIQRFVDRIPDYYVSADIPLRYDFRASLYRHADTMADLYMPLVLSNESGYEFGGYDLYYNTDDTIMLHADKLTKGWVEDYFPSWNVLGSSVYPLTAFKYVKYKPADYKVYVSVFKEKGREYFDIVLITKKPSPIRYNAASLSRGYGPEKNPAARQRYISLLNFRIARDQYVLVNYQDISIAVTDDEMAAFTDITSRNEINDWVGSAQEKGTRFYQMMASFAPSFELDHRYVLLWRSLTDNLFCPAYRGKSKEGYTLHYEWRYKKKEVGSVRSLVAFQLQEILLGIQERNLNEARARQQKVLRQQEVQRTFDLFLGR